MTGFRTAKETGDLLGLSVKALRLYEQHGLIAPGRNRAGWRLYGPDEVAALHKIQTLRSIGFGLAEVGSLLGGGISLDDVLSVQAEVIETRRAALSSAIAVITIARNRIKAGQSLSMDDLVKLTKETTMPNDDWTDAHEKLAQKHYTKDQLETLAARKLSPEMQSTIFAQWQVLIDQAERLRSGAADAPEALELARQWKTLSETFTQGDARLSEATEAWYADGFSDPDTEQLMPFSKEVWDFVGQAMAALETDRAV